MIRTAIIGVGNMGSKYASIIQSGAVPELTLAAITRVRGAYRETLLPSIEAGLERKRTGLSRIRQERKSRAISRMSGKQQIP